MATMPMPGSGAMSMVWMRMPGQSWPGAAASFLGMWIVMTAAMMLPSLVPTLRRYRRSLLRSDATHRNGMTALVAMSYFFIWTLLGAVIFPLGAALAELQRRQPALARVIPVAAGVVIAIAGAMQLSEWKARRLARCREAFGHGALRGSLEAAWRYGMRLGVDCVCSCAGAMAILLVVGMMDPRAMTVATAAITLERVAPVGARAAYVSGSAAVAAGLVLVARAVALG